MKVSIETELFAKRPLGDALDTASKLGIKHVEVGLSHFDACKATKADIKSLQDSLSDSALGLGALFALPGFDVKNWTKYSFGMSSSDEDERRKGAQLMKHAIGTASELGVRIMTSELSGDMDHSERSLRSFKKSVEEILPDLAATGTTICFDAHPGDFIEDALETMELLKSFSAKQIKYNYSISHTFTMRHAPTEIAKAADRMLAHVYFSDTIHPDRIYFCPTYTPKVLPHLHVIPGMGDIDFGEVRRALEGVNFDGFFALTPFSNQDHAEDAAAKTYRKLRQVFE